MLLSKVSRKDVLREVVANTAMRIPIVRHWRVKSGRTCDDSAGAEKFLIQFKEFIEVAGPNALPGKVLLEVGPGDLVAMALLFVGAGAQRYIAVDRFLGDVLGPAARRSYALTYEAAPDSIKHGLSARGLDPSLFPWTDPAPGGPLVSLYPIPLETAANTVPPADVIFSFNVVEHLYDIDAAFASMKRLLRPGGVMAHRVDFAPHSCWLKYENPLTFLTIGSRLWDAMGSHRGMPNRQRHGQVIASLERCGFKCETKVLKHFELRHVQAARPLLPPSQQTLSDEDLSIDSAWIVAR